MNSTSGPDFVCIGAQKTATTWLYSNLACHKDVWMPPIKEFHYFNRVCMNDLLLGNWNIPHPHGLSRYYEAIGSMDIKKLKWLLRYYELGLGKKWYLQLFEKRYSNNRICGDITPGYSTMDERGVRYASEVLGSNVKILFLIRNPVFRSWSAAKMMLRGRGEEVENLSDDSLISLLKSPNITLCSEYFRVISLWRKYFKNFYILSYDQLSHSPNDFLSEISRILHIKDTWEKKLINKRVWTDSKEIPMPPGVFNFLLDQYYDELNSLLSVEGCGYVEEWQANLQQIKLDINMCD